jgi:hypothetical protein
MKGYKQLLPAVFMLLVSCNKDHETDDPYWGTVTALQNGQAWSARIIGNHTSTYTAAFNLSFSRSNQAGFERESIGILNIAWKTGWNRVYKIDYLIPDSLKTTAVYYSVTDDGDVICDHYHVIDTDSLFNFVQVGSYDNNTREVRGNFSLKMLVKLPKCNLSAPDTLIFSNGTFHTIVR